MASDVTSPDRVQPEPVPAGPAPGPSGELPVKVVFERRARSGCKAALETWAAELVRSAARSPDLQGSSVLTREDDYFVLLRFASQQALEAWQSAPEVADLLAQGKALATPPRTHVRTGLETWFQVPGVPRPPHAPPRWKMALVTWVMLMPLVYAMSHVVPPEWPVLPKLAVSTLVPVCLLTWVVMPNVTRLLYRWLYAPVAAPPP